MKAMVEVAKVIVEPVVVAQPEPRAVKVPTPPLPIHTPFTAKQPFWISMPPVAEKVVVAVRKFATPWIAKSELGEVVPMPTFPALSIKNFVAEDEPTTNEGAVPFAAIGFTESCAHGEVVANPTLPPRYAVVVFGSNQYGAVVLETAPMSTMSLV